MINPGADTFHTISRSKTILGLYMFGIVRRLRTLIGEDLSRDELLGLLSPIGHLSLLTNRRSAMIISRVRLIAILFAILTPAWMIVDFLIFPVALFWMLATARIVASIAFAWLATRTARGATPHGAHKALFIMFAVPTLFFLTSYLLVSGYPLEGLSAAVAAGYSFLPFAMLAGIAVFPLTASECFIYASPMLAAQAIAGILRWNALQWPSFAGAFWLLMVITAVATLASISQLALMTALVRQAIRDPLTASFSRSSGEELLAIHHLTAVRENRPLSAAFIDLDHFKQINDSFGHEAGDRALKEASERIRKMMRQSDILARWGGEEFLLIMPNTSQKAAEKALARLQQAGLGSRPDGAAVTASIGLAERESDACTDWPQLVEFADQRMYLAKQRGRNCIVSEATPDPQISSHATSQDAMTSV